MDRPRWCNATRDQHACTQHPAHGGNHQCDCGHVWRNELHSQCLGNNGADTRRYLNLVRVGYTPAAATWHPGDNTHG
jgi:hypothetical protein